jgi:DNA-binding MarR family transcriptional regulator
MSGTDRGAELRRALAVEWRLLGSELVLLSQAISDRLGVNGTDLRCLAILSSAGPMTAGELAERTALTTGAVTGVIDRLERAALATRERDPHDRRRVIVRALSEGDLQRRAPELDAIFGSAALGGADAGAAYTDDQLELVIDFFRRAHPMIQSQITATRQGAAADGDLSAPLGDTAAGRLVFSRGLSQVTIDAGAGPGELYRAHLEGPAPEIRVDGGTVTVRYRRFGLLDWRGGTSRFSLTPSIPWDLEVLGGASRWTADLRQLQLRSFLLRGGMSEVELDLAAPVGTVPLRITGGISRLTVRRPAGSALILLVRGGLSRLAMDGQEFGAIGGQLRLESREHREGGDHFALEITGGASRLTIETR